MDLGCVWHIVVARVHRDDVSHTNSQVPPHNLVHEEVFILCVCLLSDQSNAHSLLPLFSYSQKASVK